MNDKQTLRCQVEIPGLGQCEVIGMHKGDSLGREIHVIGACSWNGGSLIEVSDNALLRGVNCRGEALCPNSECRAGGCILESR